MASAANLMGLVNQLQNMEQSLSNILIEHCLKLASLTDANVFLLVETAEGRRYAGKRHLCESYSSGSLGPVGNDVELGLESNEPRLVEKNNLNFSWQQNSSWPNSSMGDGSFGPLNSPGQQATPPTRKRQSQQPSRGAAPAASAAAKKARLSSATEDAASPSADPASSSSASQTPASQRNLELHMTVDVKAEQPTGFDDDDDAQQQDFHHGEGQENNDADDDDIQEIPREDNNSRALVGLEGNNSANQQQLQPYNPVGYGSGQLMPEGTDMSHYYEVADVFLQSSSKAEALRNLQSMPTLDKNSCILRLLTSLGHDFSKEICSKCFMPEIKDPKFKFIFDCLFMIFWSFVPWLEELYKTGLTIPDGKTKRSIKGYIKTYLYRQFRMKVIGLNNLARAELTMA